jgi:aminobenzoyl-glutamate utilization protein B
MGVAGMPTAFVATYGSGRPVIGLFAEYDATPGNSQKPVAWREPVRPRGAGFEDGHNILGAASSAAAVATKVAMESHQIPGTIKILGTPAEKLCIGKPYLARDGYLDGLDAAIAWHPRGYNTVAWDVGLGCYQSVLFEFRGMQAYGGHPWRGTSAVDGAFLMNTITNMVKEHLPRDYVATINEIITVGGQCPTDLPEYTQQWYAFRATTRAGILEIMERLSRCAEAAALATGCSQEMRVVSGTRTWLPNHSMAELVFRNLEMVGPPRLTDGDKAFGRKLQEVVGLQPLDEPFDLTITPPAKEVTGDHLGGADDVNEFSWHAPTARLHTTYYFKYMYEDRIPSWSTAALACTNVAHQCALTAAKTMALSAVELLTSPDAVKEAQSEYRERTRDGLMSVAVPADAEPPIDAIFSFPPYYPERWHPPAGDAGFASI